MKGRRRLALPQSGPDRFLSTGKPLSLGKYVPSQRVTAPTSIFKALRSPEGRGLASFVLLWWSLLWERRGHSSHSTLPHNIPGDMGLEGPRFSRSSAASRFYAGLGPASSHSPDYLVLKEVELSALHCDVRGCLPAPSVQMLCEVHTVSPRPPRVGLTGIRIHEPRIRGLLFGG